MRSVAAAVAAVLSAVLLAGCGSGPNQVGAAAIVGGHEITIKSVQDWWDRFTSDPQRKEQLRTTDQLDDLGRVIVGESVRHELLRQVAEKERLQVDESEVSGLIAKLGGEQAAVDAVVPTIYDRTNVRDRARDQLTAAALGRKYFDTTVTFDAMIVDKRDTALAKAKELAGSGDRAHEIVAAAARENPQMAAVDLRQSIADNLDFATMSPLFSAPTGNVLAFPAAQQGGAVGDARWYVMVVRERSTGTPSTTPDAPTADKVDQGRLEGVGKRMLSLYARDIGVRLNPRYGVWSYEELDAYPTEGQIPSFVVPMASSAKS